MSLEVETIKLVESQQLLQRYQTRIKTIRRSPTRRQRQTPRQPLRRIPTQTPTSPTRTRTALQRILSHQLQPKINLPQTQPQTTVLHQPRKRTCHRQAKPSRVHLLRTSRQRAKPRRVNSAD